MTDLLTDGLRVLAHAWPNLDSAIELRGDGTADIILYDERGIVRYRLRCDLTRGSGLPTPGEALAEWRAGR